VPLRPPFLLGNVCSLTRTPEELFTEGWKHEEPEEQCFFWTTPTPSGSCKALYAGPLLQEMWSSQFPCPRFLLEMVSWGDGEKSPARVRRIVVFVGWCFFFFLGCLFFLGVLGASAPADVVSAFFVSGPRVDGSPFARVSLVSCPP